MREDSVQDLMEYETGRRHPDNSWVKNFVLFVACMWSVFQIWISSPLQFIVADYFSLEIILSDTKVRSLHLSIAIFLVFCTFPAFRKSPSSYIPILDWVWAFVASFSAMYLCLFYSDLAGRSGLPNTMDIVISALGVLSLLEAARRVMGITIALIATIFMSYAVFGSLMPVIISHKSNFIDELVTYQWLTTEGVYGIALGVSAGFVFLYVLFGSLLEKAGAGRFFIKLSFALLGKFVGGPAKAAVVASGLMGMMSGSSIANTVTVGSLTIPLMKKIGLSPEKAGAIEVSAGINGQIMPPVMGAAAFLMAEFLSIPYAEIIVHAFIPAILVYMALLYMMHLEALKLGLSRYDNREGGSNSMYHALLMSGVYLVSIFLVISVVYFLIQGITYVIDSGEEIVLIGGLKRWFGDYTLYSITVLMLSVYFPILYYQSKLEDFDPEECILTEKFTSIWEIMSSGLHYFIPIFSLVWCLTIERMSPALSAYWTVMVLSFILVTQNAIKEYFRNGFGNVLNKCKAGSKELIDGLILGAQNMIGVAIATAAAGLIVGSISLTGVGQIVTELVSYVADGSLMVILLLTALICIVLGMGMPTTACYVIVSSVMVPVLTQLTMKQGVIIPPVALHLFVFYFGLMADATPPVGLASYAASAIAQGNPIITGVQAFTYNIRTMVLPFIFVFNSDIILCGDFSVIEVLGIFSISLIGMLALSAGIQGYFIVRSRIAESCLLILVGLSLLYPKFWIDQINPEFIKVDVNNLVQMRNVEVMTDDNIKIGITGRNSFGEEEKRYALFTSDVQGESLYHRLYNAGIKINEDYPNATEGFEIISLIPRSPAAKVRLEPGFMINSFYISQKQSSNLWVLVIALSMLVLIYIIQKRRHKIIQEI